MNGFEDVPEEKAFYINDGRKVKNIFELAEAISNMKEQTFKFHVNKNKNDFSEWIRHVIGDEKLADEIARLVMKDKIQIRLQRYVIRKMLENDNNKNFSQ
ncbi:MAG: DUF5752 family protein [Candidatus Nanoarchaeia archaeon]